jgi:hypothetical protein
MGVLSVVCLFFFPGQYAGPLVTEPSKMTTSSPEATPCHSNDRASSIMLCRCMKKYPPSVPTPRRALTATSTRPALHETTVTPPLPVLFPPLLHLLLSVEERDVDDGALDDAESLHVERFLP